MDQLSVNVVRRALLVILLIALAFRAGAALLLEPPLLSDDKDYVTLATSLVQDGSYALDGTLTAYRPPGYPFFLASIFTVFGHSLVAVRLVQVLLDTFICLLLFRLALRYIGSRYALVATAVYAVFPLQLLYVASAMSETVFTFLFLLSVTLLTEKDADWRTYAMAGIAAGLSMLVRPTGMLLFVLIFFFPAMLTVPWHKQLRTAIPFFIAALIVIGPWLLRNEAAFGRLTLASHAGVNFWIGNHEGANGSYSYPEGNPLTNIEDEFARSDEGFRLGLEFLASHPLKAAVITGKKFAHFFGIDYWALMSHQYDPSWSSANRLSGVVGNLSPASILATHLPVMVVCLLALFCLAALPEPERRQWMVIALLVSIWLLVHLAFFGSARMRVPMHPFLILAAVKGWTLLRSGLYPHTTVRKAVLVSVGSLLVAGWVVEASILLSY